MLQTSREFTFFGLHRQPARCGLRIFSRLAADAMARPIHDDEDATTRAVVVIVTELQDNPGASITNTAESCAAQVCVYFNIHPSRLVWIENYDERALPRCQWAHYRPTGESYDLVSFDFRSARAINDGGPTLGRPTWKYCDKATVETMIGETLP